MANYMFDVIEHIRENLPRLEDIYSSQATEDQEAYSDEEIMNHAFWLNDLLFICPPQSINTQTDQLIAKYQSLRSSASSKVPFGKGTKYFMVDLVIPAKSAIMNVDYRLPDNNAVATVSHDSDYVNTGKRGGILDLIIQFKVTPFARVENAFIRSTLGIPKDKNIAMCLHQLTLYTIKGRKGAVGCKLLMSVFNYSPYSPNFVYKEDWVTKSQYGRFNIESVNRIDFGDRSVARRRVPYKVYIQGLSDAVATLRSEEVEAQQATSPLVQRVNPVTLGSFYESGNPSSLSNAERSRAFEEQYNMLFTENEDEMSNVDSYFMESPRGVANPASSAVFKAYIDWIHSQWTSINDIDGEFNGSAISQYGSEEQDLGDQVILEWKEFKTEPMPPEVEQEVRIWYRQRMADYQAARSSREEYTPATPQNSNQSTNTNQTSTTSNQNNNTNTSEGLSVITSPSYQDWANQSGNPLEPYRVIYDPVTPRPGGRFAVYRRPRNYNHKGIDTYSQSVGEIGYEIRAIYNGNLHYQLSRKEGILTNEIARKIIQYKTTPGNETKSSGELDGLSFSLKGFEEYRDDGPAGVFLKRGGVFYPVEGIIETTSGRQNVYYFTYLKEGRETRGGVIASIRLDDGTYAGTDLDGIACNYMHIGVTEEVKNLIDETTDSRGGSKRSVVTRIQAGDFVAYGGCTGIYESYPHLHFEMAKDDWYPDLDIIEYLDSTPFVFPGQRSDVTGVEAEQDEDIRNNPIYYLNNLDLNTWTNAGSPGLIESSNSGTLPEEVETLNQPTGIDRQERERQQARDYNAEALGSLEQYRAFVERQESQGWKLYTENTLAYNIFYRVKRISIPASDQENYPLGVPIVCDFISGGASNIIASIPMMGQTYPTAQFLGRRDDEFMLSFRAIGLNNVKLLSRMRDELKSQAHSYKWIPDAWMLKVENKFINAFGHRYFVVNNMSEVTSPGQPNTYNIEIGITSHPANTDQGQITSMQAVNKEEIKLTFWEELLHGYKDGEDEGRILIEKQTTWALVSMPGIVAGTTVKPFISENQDSFVSEDRTAPYTGIVPCFVANPRLLSISQNNIQATSTATSVADSTQDPNQEFFNWLNVRVASTLNLVRLLEESVTLYDPSTGERVDVSLSRRYKNLYDRIFYLWRAKAKKIPLGSGNIVAETTLMAEMSNRKIVNSFAQENVIREAYSGYGLQNWFIEENGLTRWNSNEKIWTFGDNVARLEDFVGLDASLNVTSYEGGVNLALTEAYNYSLREHTDWNLNGEYRPNTAVPMMEAYLDVNPVVKALLLSNYLSKPEIYLFDELDRSNSNYRGSIIDYFCSLFKRELRAGFDYPAFSFSRPLIYGNVITFRTIKPSLLYDYEYVAKPFPMGRDKSPVEITEPIFVPSSATTAPVRTVPFEPSFSSEVLLKVGRRDLAERILNSPLVAGSNINFNNLSIYIWDQLSIPYLNNAFSMEDIIKYSQYTWPDGKAIFPRTQELLKRERIGVEGVAYPDMMLPLHPFWTSQNSLLPVSSIYTEPDFYLINYGVDTNTESTHLEPISDPSNPKTSENATNLFIQTQAELASQSLDMMEGKARDERGALIGGLTHTTVEGIEVQKSKPFIEMVNPINSNALGLFKGDPVYLRSDHSIGSYYSSGNVDPNTGRRTKDYSEAMRQEALGSGAVNIRKTRSADASSDTLIGQKITQSTIDSRFEAEGLSYFQGVSRSQAFEYTASPQGSDVQLNAGMNTLLNEGGGNSNLVLWRSVVPMFAPNTAFPETPLSFGGRSFVGMGFDGYSRYSPASMIDRINNEADAVYEFNTESSTSDPSAFVNGNWGYSDIHQFTTSRLSTYEKIRDGLKGLNIKKWAFRRAFPTFKVYIIEEDEIEREWIQYDDFYQYNQIQEIQISESRKRPAPVCIINFINVGGALDGNNQWHYWARNNPNQEYDAQNPNVARSYSRREQRMTSDTSNQLLAGTAEEQNITRFVLNPGVKIKVKLGYSNNPTKMEDVFLGSIAEIVPDADAGSVVIIAQGYGAELVEKPKGASKEEIANTYFTTFDVLASLMFSSEVKHFGKRKIDSVSMIGTDQSLAQNELIYRNTVSQTTSSFAGRLFGGFWRAGIAAATLGTSEAIIAAVGLANDLAYEIDRQLRQVRVGPEEGPQDDNIYAPNYSRAELNYHWWNPENLVNGRWRQSEQPTSVGLETVSSVLDPEDGGAEAQSSRPSPPGNIQEREFDIPAGAGTRIADPNFQYYEQISPAEIEYNIFYSSIWDVFQEMTLRHPGFVKHPRIYKNSNRMTMFFGLPDQKYWASEPSIGEITQANATFSRMRDGIVMVQVSGPTVNRSSQGITEENPGQLTTVTNLFQNRTTRSTGGGDAPGELAVDLDLLTSWMSMVQRRLKPFRNWYSVDSVTDIVENRIEANKLGFYTSVSLQYLSGASASKLKGALRRLERGGGADSELITPSNFIAWSDREVEHTQAHRDMSPDEIRQKFHQFANCRSRSMARRYSRALLASYAKEMYKGTISMIGNSKVKPYDVLLINDTHHNVQGPIEVEEVIHNFNPMTGFITEVIPDTFIIQEDRTAFVVWNSLRAHAGLKTSRHMEGILFQRDNTLPDNNAFNLVADRYRRIIESEREINRRFDELVSDLRNGLYLSERTGGLVLGSIGAGVVGASITAPGVGAGALTAVAAIGTIALGVGIYFGLISNFVTSIYVNYVHNNRAYFMIPLMRNNTAWTVGYNITGTNSFAMGILDLIRRWWQDGGEGVTLSNVDAAMTEQRIALTLSSELNTFSRLSIRWDQFTRSFRTGLTLGGSVNVRSGL
jgi:hypothetical protein